MRLTTNLPSTPLPSQASLTPASIAQVSPENMPRARTAQSAMRENMLCSRSNSPLAASARSEIAGTPSNDVTNPFAQSFASGLTTASRPNDEGESLEKLHIQDISLPTEPATAAPPLPKTAQKVAGLLASIGHDKPVIMLPSTGKTAVEAAIALECDVSSIANCIVFRRQADDVPVVVIASGVNRIDERKVAGLVGPIGKVDAKYVKKHTGYSIGGVSPIGIKQPSVVLIDKNVLALESVWAAAGHPHAVFNVTPNQLLAMTKAPVNDLAA